MLFGVVRHTRQPPQELDGLRRVWQPPHVVRNYFTSRLQFFHNYVATVPELFAMRYAFMYLFVGVIYVFVLSRP